MKLLKAYQISVSDVLLQHSNIQIDMMLSCLKLTGLYNGKCPYCRKHWCWRSLSAGSFASFLPKNIWLEGGYFPCQIFQKTVQVQLYIFLGELLQKT